MKHAYSDFIIHEGRNHSIVYYDFEENVYPIIGIKELISRTQEEKKKFFNSKPSLSGTNLEKLSKELATKMAKQATTVIAYLTPNKIVSNNKTLDTSNPSSVDLDSFNQAIGMAKKQITREAINPKSNKKKKISIKTAKKIDTYLNIKESGNKTITENLGKTSKFRKADEIYKPTITSKVVSKVKGKLKDFKKRKPAIKQYSADSDRIKNLIKKIDTIVLPPSLISVIASESRSTKNNALTSRTDLASNSETKDFFSVMYSNPIQIEVIESYAQDARGRTMYNRPMWKLLDEKDLEKTSPLICRFRVYNAKHFDSQDLDLNIANENFVLMFNSVITKTLSTKEVISMSDIVNTIDEAEKVKIEYQSSNLIKQSEEKDGPLQ